VEMYSYKNCPNCCQPC